MVAPVGLAHLDFQLPALPAGAPKELDEVVETVNTLCTVLLHNPDLIPEDVLVDLDGSRHLANRHRATELAVAINHLICVGYLQNSLFSFAQTINIPPTQADLRAFNRLRQQIRTSSSDLPLELEVHMKNHLVNYARFLLYATTFSTKQDYNFFQHGSKSGIINAKVTNIEMGESLRQVPLPDRFQQILESESDQLEQEIQLNLADLVQGLSQIIDTLIPQTPEHSLQHITHQYFSHLGAPSQQNVERSTVRITVQDSDDSFGIRYIKTFATP